MVLEFNDSKQSWFIRADLSSQFSCLTFPETFHRARKNSIDLFDDIVMKKVINVRQFENERAFAIEAEGGWSLIFKMHGNRSNILLAHENVVQSLFKNSIIQDMNLDPRQLDRTIEGSEETLLVGITPPEKVFFTFGKPVWSFLESHGFSKKYADEQWAMVRQVTELLEKPDYYIVRDKKLHLSLLNHGNVIETYTDPFVAVNNFYQRYVSEGSFVGAQHSIVSKLKNEIANTRSWLAKTGAKIDELKKDDHYKSWGDLLMANLYMVKPDSKSIELNDFYDPDKVITIKIDPQLSAQKNAERFYRKGKNQQIEITKLTEGYEARQRGLVKLEENLAKAEGATSTKVIQEIAIGWEPKTGAVNTSAVPYREFEYKGFRIWVGKDAKTNDELTLKYSYKEDLWLHVRDDTGSHVLLKYQAGKPFPKDVIERAASLAAFYSKRKTEALCAVVVTPKKFIRKRKGDPAGAVVVEREEVILVEPKQ
jgi:predicted ribosome quality control (RQC) complex YloA/Tae2 family protein